jgi:hypothetical protein
LQGLKNVTRISVNRGKRHDTIYQIMSGIDLLYSTHIQRAGAAALVALLERGGVSDVLEFRTAMLVIRSCGTRRFGLNSSGGYEIRFV